jgi:magnesium chelatase accessory protein
MDTLPPGDHPRLDPDWPNREASRFVRAAGLTWHVQVMGTGPALLLVHGTGASTHSWRDVMPALADRFTVVAPDLPGHGFTGMPAPHRLSLPGMSRALAGLLQALQVEPVLAAGHSAGAAILARMSLDGLIAPRAVVSLNGAMLPPAGLPGRVFSPVAQFLVRMPAVPSLFAWRAGDRQLIERMLRATGSRLDPAGVEFYRRLASRSGHVKAALGMMAHWDLRPLLHDLPRLTPRLVLVVGSNDGTIPPTDAEIIRQALPSAVITTLPGLGHLAHEEQPLEAARLISSANL